jgi:serine/threonine-protein kinase
LKVARVIAEIHRQGHLHRDLKPSNIRVTRDGDVELLDFGLATLSERLEGGDGDEPAARPILVGAPQYMSPEQVRGEPLDVRSDVFSFGVVLYEMACGKRPFSGATSEDVLHEIVRAQPIPPTALVPSLPRELEEVIKTALAPAPEQRYQSMDEVVRGLESAGRKLEAAAMQQRGRRITDRRAAPVAVPSRGGLLVAAIAILVLIGGLLAGRRLMQTAPDERTVLVFPFEVRGQAEGAEYVGRSLAEALAINLAQAHELRVLPVPQKGEIEGVGALARARAAERVGAGRLLAGAITRDGTQVRASVSLVDSAENRILWGTRMQAHDGDLPTLAMSLARAVAGELGATFPRMYDYIGNVSGSPAMAASPQTALAQEAMRAGDIASMRKATRELVEAFPDEPDAHALRTQALVLAWDADPTATRRAALERSIRRLDETAPDNPYGASFRAYLLHQDGKSEAAIEAFSRVIARPDLTPSLRAWALRYRALAKEAVEGKQSALVDLEEAHRLDPANAWTFHILSRTLLSLGRTDEALTRARQAVALVPSFWRNHNALGSTLSELGRHEEARDAFEVACRLGNAQLPCALYALALLRTGDEAAAARAVERASKLTEDAHGTYNLACYWALTGHQKRALVALKRAIDLGFSGSLLTRDPDLASLREDPEFVALVGSLKKARPEDAWPE